MPFSIEKLIGFASYTMFAMDAKCMKKDDLVNIMHSADRRNVNFCGRTISQDSYTVGPQKTVVSRLLLLLAVKSSPRFQNEWNMYFEMVGDLIAVRNFNNTLPYKNRLSVRELRYIDEAVSEYKTSKEAKKDSP